MEIKQTSSPGDPDRPRFVVRDRRYWAEGSAAGEGEEARHQPAYVQQLEQRLAAAEAQADELRRGVRTLRQEDEELRARRARELEQERARLVCDVVSGLLPVLDDLRRSEEAAAQGVGPEPLRQGLRLVVEGFQKRLQELGAEPIEDVGKPFDPNVHHAVTTEACAEDQDGRVLRSFQRGYRIGDLVVRPAQVVVGATANG